MPEVDKDRDVSPHMLELATQRLEALNNVELHEITGFDLRPLADEVADVVYSTVVFMHLEQWDRFNYVLEAHRVLRPGGRIFVDNVNLCSDEGWQVFEVHRQIPHHLRAAHITKHSTLCELKTYLRAGSIYGDSQPRSRRMDSNLGNEIRLFRVAAFNAARELVGLRLQ